MAKRKQAKQKKSSANDLRALAQEIMPIKTIEGSFIRRKDGSSILLVFVEGINDSLNTYGQKLSESDANRYALAGINHPVSIIKVMKSVSATAQLAHIDAEIAKLRREVREMGREMDEGHPKTIRLRLLEERIRPAAEAEALSGNRVTHPTYFAFEFSPKVADDVAGREARLFCDRVIETEGNAHICSFSEVIEALQLYFLPGGARPSAIAGNAPVMPKRKVG